MPYLPSELIPTVFKYLEGKAGESQQLKEVFAYVDATWVKANARWTPASWSAFRQSVRTNNDVEGWHHALNSKAPQGNLTLYKIAPLLFDQAKLVNLQLKLVGQQKLCRYQRKTYRNLHGRLVSLWDQLDKKTKKPLDVVEAAAHLYGNLPVNDKV
ncbi:uncharacterized protein [Amphiura filiformis]|uniref:uncharacterized protein n=1 Tax=Amphiura filiformis TaxID=82378 RepID=UPI003B21DE19